MTLYLIRAQYGPYTKVRIGTLSTCENAIERAEAAAKREGIRLKEKGENDNS